MIKPFSVAFVDNEFKVIDRRKTGPCTPIVDTSSIVQVKTVVEVFNQIIKNLDSFDKIKEKDIELPFLSVKHYDAILGTMGFEWDSDVHFPVTDYYFEFILHWYKVGSGPLISLYFDMLNGKVIVK